MASPRIKTLSVVMPVFNEEKTVGKIIEKVLAEDCVTQAIIVNDGSSDGSLAIIREWERKDPRITVVDCPKNRGKGAALREGFRIASGDIIAVQDADLEYDPADFSAILDAFSEDVSIVYGTRFPRGRLAAGRKTFAQSAQFLVNRTLTVFSNGVTGGSLSDVCTCYKAFRRELLPLLDLKEDRFGFCFELTAKAMRLGYPIAEVPISYSPRTYREGKKIKMSDGISGIRCLIVYSLSS